MRIVVVGALGGIGRHLIDTLAPDHDVVGVAPTAPSRSMSASPVRYVSYSDRESLAAAISDADVVIHAALDRRKRGPEFVRRNTTITRELIDLARSGPPKRFVYLSSWAVYSTDTPGPTGYREDQHLALRPNADNYSRLKLVDERQIIAACAGTSIRYLILRPTIVVGPGPLSPRAIVRLARILPFGLRGRTFNVLHVKDLCSTITRLIELDIADEVLNVGGSDIQSDELAAAVGKLANRKMRILARMPLPKRFIPSTLWFLTSDVHINSEKVRQLTGIRPERPVSELVTADPLAEERVDSVETMRAIQVSDIPFWAYGIGYAAFLNPNRRVEFEKRVLLERHRGIVSLDGNRVTVKAGTTLTELTGFLRQFDLTLATLPEFTGATAGACFFVDVHGSSNELFSLLDLIVEVKYLDAAGQIAVAKRGDYRWQELRHGRARVFLTEVTFDCVPAQQLMNRIESVDDSFLSDYILHRHRENLSTVVQWYPAYRRLTVYNINRAEVRPANSAKPMGTYRSTPYPIHRLANLVRLRGRETIYGHQTDVLGSWKDLPLRKWWYRIPTREPEVLDVELLLSLPDAARLIEKLQAMPRRDNPVFGRRTSLGFRFAYRTTEDGRSMGYVWIEWVTKDKERLRNFTDLVETLTTEGVRYHQGKYVPPWVSSSSTVLKPDNSTG